MDNQGYNEEHWSSYNKDVKAFKFSPLKVIFLGLSVFFLIAGLTKIALTVIISIAIHTIIIHKVFNIHPKYLGNAIRGFIMGNNKSPRKR